jgi:PE-PPE domain
MTNRKLRGLGVVLIASTGAAVMGFLSMVNAGFAYGDDTALILGGSGMPMPTPSYVDAVEQLFLTPGFSSYTPQALFTPEELYPITGVMSSTANTSVAEGQQILNDAILQDTTDGGKVVVFGYSQSADISTLEMEQLASMPDAPSQDQLAFVLTGNVNNPNGGVLERFDGLVQPIGVTFDGATPGDVYPTTIYTQEYDGLADFPRYPIDFLADLNAALAIPYVHYAYESLTPEQVASAITLPTEGPTDTTYYMIPTQDLPLLDPLREIPVIGNPLADLLQPDLQVLVNLGYGPDNLGYSDTAANVPTPFGLFPAVNPATVLNELATGAQQGVQSFLTDFAHLSVPSLSSLPDTLSALSDAVTSVSSLLSSPTDLVNALTNVVSTDIATIPALVDLIPLFLGVTLPAYDANLFVDGLDSGNLLDAIGLPIAADLGLGTFGPLGETFSALLDVAATDLSDLGLGSLVSLALDDLGLADLIPYLP